MMQLPPPSKTDMLAELDRELKMRAEVYPRLVFTKKLRQSQADRQIEVMRAIRGLVEKMA